MGKQTQFYSPYLDMDNNDNGKRRDDKFIPDKVFLFKKNGLYLSHFSMKKILWLLVRTRHLLAMHF